MGQSVCIHINGSLAHQVRHGEVLKAGFERHGCKAWVSTSPEGEADIHVVSGPYFAKQRWLGHPRTILLDRCYYRGDPEHVSLGWMRPDGGRRWRRGNGRVPPVPKPVKPWGTKLFMADFRGPVLDGLEGVRYHPADPRCPPTQPGLLEHLKHYSFACGYETSALVTAALEGLEVECYGTKHILNEKNWLALLPYADWSHDDIESGKAAAYLLETE